MEPYNETIGCIMYLMVGTRRDLAYFVCILAMFVESQTAIHWVAVQRVIKYILSTKHFHLCDGGPREILVPFAHVDEVWAGDISARKSMSGCLVIMRGAAASWVGRQPVVLFLVLKLHTLVCALVSRKQLGFADWYKPFQSSEAAKMLYSHSCWQSHLHTTCNICICGPKNNAHWRANPQHRESNCR